jgi:hypothetical protein
MDATQSRSATMLKLAQIAAVLFIFWPQNGHAAMEITPRVSAGAEYTDNVRLSPETRTSDIISTVTPGITLDISGRPAGLTLDYAPSYVDYADEPTTTTGVIWPVGRHGGSRSRARGLN